MPDSLRYFESPGGTISLAMPIDYRQIIADWGGLRRLMVRSVPEQFTRDEWAYLISFLENSKLISPFQTTFGLEVEEPISAPFLLYRPRGPISVWLPNNVSLLGPLTLILLSLTGQPIRLKLGSSAQDLAGTFLDYACKHLPAGEFKNYLATNVRVEIFDRNDIRQQDLAREARIRIVFGSDAAAESIHDLRHPLESQGFSFVDRQSEAWLEPDAVNEQVLATLIKVFAIYGQVGCTSPKRVILIGGTKGAVQRLRDDMLDLWPAVIRDDAQMHIASTNVMSQQMARSLGWDALCTQGNSAMLACGSLGLPLFDGTMSLRIQGARPDQAVRVLPANIQTIGHALVQPDDPDWLKLLSGSRVRRFVPLGQMHHFGNIWDGQEFWRQCFEPMELHG